MSNTFFEKLQGKYLPTLSRVNYSCVETILGFSDCMSFSFRIHTGSTEHKHMHGNERAGHSLLKKETKMSFPFTQSPLTFSFLSLEGRIYMLEIQMVSSGI